MGKNRFDSYHYGEARTGIGQLVHFTCPSDTDLDQVEAFISGNIRRIDPVVTRDSGISHGGYTFYSRYDVVQHRYAGGNIGFIELLEVKNPPDGRCGIVIYERQNSVESYFTEWEDLKAAESAFKENWRRFDASTKHFVDAPGFKRLVTCGPLVPWFYTVGGQAVVGDYAFPEGLQDDLVYRAGRRFVAFDADGTLRVKVCMGTRVAKKFLDYSVNPSGEERVFRIVYFDDGSIWDESQVGFSRYPPRPVEDGEEWILAAVEQFRQLLAGKKTEFSIDFIDGHRFLGKVVRPKQNLPAAEGSYLVDVHLKDGRKKSGWVNNFRPTQEHQDVVSYVVKELAGPSVEVERVEIKESRPLRGGKKWKGVFHSR